MKRQTAIALIALFVATVGLVVQPRNAEAGSNCPVWYQSWCRGYWERCPLDGITECNIRYYRFGCSAYDAACTQDAFYCPPINFGEPAGYLMECWFDP